MKSFYEKLKERGYEHNKAVSICALAEYNPHSLNEKLQNLYWDWFNEELIKKGDEK